MRFSAIGIGRVAICDIRSSETKSGPTCRRHISSFTLKTEISDRDSSRHPKTAHFTRFSCPRQTEVFRKSRSSSISENPQIRSSFFIRFTELFRILWTQTNERTSKEKSSRHFSRDITDNCKPKYYLESLPSGLLQASDVMRSSVKTKILITRNCFRKQMCKFQRSICQWNVDHSTANRTLVTHLPPTCYLLLAYPRGRGWGRSRPLFRSGSVMRFVQTRCVAGR